MSGHEQDYWDDTTGAALSALSEVSGGGLSHREISSGPGALTIIDADLAREWWDRVAQSRVIPQVLRWRKEDSDAAGKQPGGPKPLISDAVFLTVAFILVMENKAVRITDIGRIFESRLSDGAKDVLGIRDLYDGTQRNWYFLAHRAAHRLIATWDAWIPNDGFKRNKHKGMTLQERRLWEAALDQDLVEKMRARGDWFINALIEMSLQQQTRRLRRKKVALSIDQTSVRAGVQQARWKRDPNTGEEVEMKNSYTDETVIRRVLALEADWVPKKKGSKKRNADLEKSVTRIKWELAYMANIVIDVADDPRADKKGAAPQLVRAASLGSPNRRIAEHTLALLDSLQARGYDITRLTFDRGYSQLKDEFHLGLVGRGIPVVKDYVERQKGITNGALGGAILSDDRYVCPSTPTELLEATKEYDQGRLTDEEYWAAKDKLDKYNLSVHQKKADGTLRLSCPAAGPSPTASCPLRKLMQGAVPDEDADRVRIYGRDITELQKHYKVCQQQSITLKPDVAPQQRQKLRYGSREWFKTFRVDRNSMESANKTLQKALQLDDTTNRPMRGLASQQFALALIVVAMNMKRIVQYEHEQYKLERRTAAGRAPSPRKPKHELLQRARDRFNESRYKRNPEPLDLVPVDDSVYTPPMRT